MALGPRPAYLAKNDISTVGSRLAGGLATPRPARISLNDNRFTLFMDSGERHPMPPALSIQVIFVGGNSHVSKTFYDSDTYDAEATNAPVCWSDNGIGPSEQVSTPKASTCAFCPNNVWVGKTPPLCSDRKKTAVLVAGAGETVFLLDMPPASLKPFRKYMAHLGSEVHVSPEQVVTTLTMENRVLQFEDAAWVPEDLQPTIAKIVESSEIDHVVNELDRPHQGALSKPVPDWAKEPIPQSIHNDPIPETFAPVPASKPVEAAADPFAAMRPKPAEEVPPAPKPRGRPRKDTTLGPGPIPAGTFDAPKYFDDVVNLARSQPSAQQQVMTANEAGAFIRPEFKPAAPSFGIAEPQKTTSELDDMLTKAFGLKLGQ